MANKLYPLSSIAQQIEDFALDMLLSIAKDETAERTDAEESTTEPQKVLLLCIF